MDKKQILSTLEKAEESKKRNFPQTYDLVINLKNLNLKNPDHKVDLFLALPYNRGKEIKICAFIDKDLSQEAKQCDFYILKDDFPIYAKKQKDVKKLAEDYDFFIAQANIMPDVAKTFGKILGQKGKMPSPKSGCIVPPKILLKPLIERLKKTVRVQTKNEAILKVPVGKEGMYKEEIASNIEYVYNNILRALPEEEKSIKNIFIKLTMGKPAYLFGTSEEDSLLSKGKKIRQKKASKEGKNKKIEEEATEEDE